MVRRVARFARGTWIALVAIGPTLPALAGCSLVVGDETRVVVGSDDGAAPSHGDGDGGAPPQSLDAAAPSTVDAAAAPPLDAKAQCTAPSPACITEVGTCSGRCAQEAQKCADNCNGGGGGDNPGTCTQACDAKHTQCTSDCVTHCVKCAGAAACDPQSACANGVP